MISGFANMELLKEFLNTSTIHGLSWISNTKSYARVFWLFVVIAGFFGAIFLIQKSFSNWKQNPISTTIETKIMSEITIPNITVCPPKDLNLNLNFDIMKAHGLQIDEQQRIELYNYALIEFQEIFSNNLMQNLSKIVDPERYRNWYYGFTQISFPYINEDDNELWHYINTTATSGRISTQYFGDKLQGQRNKLDELEKNIHILIELAVPNNLVGDNEAQLDLNIKKEAMTTTSDTYRMFLGLPNNEENDIDNEFSDEEIKGPFNTSLRFSIHKTLLLSDILKLEHLPGFRLTWKFDKDGEQKPKFSDNNTTKEFAR